MRCRVFSKMMAGMMAVAMVAGVMMVPAKAHAYSDENVEVIEFVEKVEEEEYGPLTPDGNLSLVDDYGSFEAGGKQFITVVTKAGNYFYIIIDRDDQGSETVHFLNMVDEEDLLTLMDEEEQKSYLDSLKEKEEVKEVVETPVIEEVEKEPEAVNASGMLLPMFLLGVGGIVFYVYLQKRKQTDKDADKPDPDADYHEDEEDYLASIPVEEDDE